MDGYRRLERTRTVATPSHAIAATAVLDERVGSRESRRRSARRLAGAVRLLAFVVVLAMIVGTSVSIARSTSGDPAPATREPASEKAAIVAEDDATTTVDSTRSPLSASADVSAKDAPAAKAGDSSSDAASSDDVVVADTASAAPAATAAPSSTTTTERALPLTGTIDSKLILLAGCALVLLGMLVQVAGQPLPARARARR